MSTKFILNFILIFYSSFDMVFKFKIKIEVSLMFISFIYFTYLKKMSLRDKTIIDHCSKIKKVGFISVIYYFFVSFTKIANNEYKMISIHEKMFLWPSATPPPPKINRMHLVYLDTKHPIADIDQWDFRVNIIHYQYTVCLTEILFCDTAESATINKWILHQWNVNIRGAFNKFPDFFIQAFKIVVDSWKFSIYCYTSYEMTDQFLWFQVQINSYSRNSNTPY